MAIAKITPIILSDLGSHFIGSFEGFSSRRYQDGGGLWTVGYGHLIKDIAAFDKSYPNGMTKEQAALQMKLDAAATIQGLTRLELDLPFQHHQDAVISLVYNIGVGAFAKSVIFAALKAKSRDLWAWERWVHDNKGVIERGLVKRRTAEQELFIWGNYNWQGL